MPYKFLAFNNLCARITHFNCMYMLDLCFINYLVKNGNYCNTYRLMAFLKYVISWKLVNNCYVSYNCRKK